MPSPGQRWYHATFSTHNSWLPGDPRGFRTIGHKIHSSGDHRNPPPQGEHVGLHTYSKNIAAKPIILNEPMREIVGRAVVRSFKNHACQPLVIAVSPMHTHALVELPATPASAKQVVGYTKLSASMKLNSLLAGRVWARGCNLTPIKDENHQRNTYRYISRHAADGAWVWTFRDAAAAAERRG